MRITCIVNPAAGRGRTVRLWPQIAAMFARVGVAPDVVRTQRAGEARLVARAADCDVVVAVGGDGTVHEVVNGLMEAGRGLTLGIIPTGRGHDMCKAAGIGIPADIAEAVRTVIGYNSLTLDVGRVEYTALTGRPEARHWLNIASVGFDAAVTEEANRPPDSFETFKHLSPYYASIFHTLVRYRNHQTRVQYDDRPPFVARLNSVVVANGNYYGNGMRIAPMAACDDGLFDVVTLGDLTKAEIGLLSPLLYSGLHRFYPKVAMARARIVRVETLDGARVPIQADGEVVGVAPATFSIVPGALRLKVP